MSRPSTGPSGDAPVAAEPPSIAARLTSLERVMGVVDSRVDDQQLRSARDVTRQITERLSLSPAHTVVALAGATGSGKSSIYNALAGLDLSEVGVRRPVTNAPHACVWGPDGAGPLLDWLSIPYDNRTGRESALDADSQAELRGLVLLDLPDHDSTQLAHRLEVDRLVELVDLLVWVLDPQKYADEAVHSRYLRRLSRHAGVTVVVLNQVDLLSSADAEACLADVRRLLDADGLRGVPLVPLSALRGDGLPELKDRITTTVASRQASVQRLAADLDDVADELAPLAGPEVREDVDRGAAKRLYTTLAEAAGATAVGEAVERGYKFTASRTLGWPLIHWFGRTKADPLAPLRENAGKSPRTRTRTTARPAVLHPVQQPQVEEALRHLADDTANALPDPWPGLVHRAARSEIDQLPDVLDRAVATADLGLARRPTWWLAYRVLQYLLVLALFGGVVWALGLAIAAAVGGADSALSGSDLVAPLVLLMGGLVLGPVLHVVGMVLAGRGARSARLRAEQAVLDAVTTVARERVLAPVRAELSAYALVRDALIDFGVLVPSRVGSSASSGEGDASVLGEDSVSKDAHDGLGPLPSAAGYPDPFRQSAALNGSSRSDVGVMGPRPEVDGLEPARRSAVSETAVGTPTSGAPLTTDAGVSEPETGQPMTGHPHPDHAHPGPERGGRPAGGDRRGPGQPGIPAAGADRRTAGQPGSQAAAGDWFGNGQPGIQPAGADRTGVGHPGSPAAGGDWFGSEHRGSQAAGADWTGVGHPGSPAAGGDRFGSEHPGNPAAGGDRFGSGQPGSQAAGADWTGVGHPGSMAAGGDRRVPEQGGAAQGQPWRPAPPQPGDARGGSVPPPPRPDAVRHGAVPPAPASPPLAPGVRPFLSAHTPPPPTVVPPKSPAAPSQARFGERPTPPAATATPPAGRPDGTPPPSRQPSAGPTSNLQGTGPTGDTSSAGPAGGRQGTRPTGDPSSPGLAGGRQGTRSVGDRPNAGPESTSGGGSEGATSRPSRRSGQKLPPAPPPRPAVEADPEVVWARTRPNTTRDSAVGADGRSTDSRSSGGPISGGPRAGEARSDADAGRGPDGIGGPRGARAPRELRGSGDIDFPASTEPDGVTQPQRKGLRGLFGRRKESADVVDRWWATTDDGDDPFGRPGADSSDDSRRQRPVPDQR